MMYNPQKFSPQKLPFVYMIKCTIMKTVKLNSCVRGYHVHKYKQTAIELMKYISYCVLKNTSNSEDLYDQSSNDPIITSNLSIFFTQKGYWLCGMKICHHQLFV